MWKEVFQNLSDIKSPYRVGNHEHLGLGIPDAQYHQRLVHKFVITIQPQNYNQHIGVNVSITNQATEPLRKPNPNDDNP